MSNFVRATLCASLAISTAISFMAVSPLASADELLESGIGAVTPPAATPVKTPVEKEFGYVPTILNSMDEAQALFQGLRKLPGGDSQCHQRAMYWSYNMFVDQRINSMKVFIFYSRKFQETFRKERKFWFDSDYKWWYHTAPMVYVRTPQGGIKEVVLDATFMDQAVTLDEWTHHFVAEESLNYVDADHRGLMPQLSRQESKCFILANAWDMGHFNRKHEAIASKKENKKRIKGQKGDYAKLRAFWDVHRDEPWCMVRKVPMFYMQPNSVDANDCDPNKHAWNGNFERRADGQLIYPCAKEAQRTDFRDPRVAFDVIGAFEGLVDAEENDHAEKLLKRETKQIKNALKYYADQLKD
jgi:hypothetical protein